MAKANRCLSLLLSLEILFASSSGMAADRYQLIGKITLKDREFSRKTLPIVLLEGIKIPYLVALEAPAFSPANTLADCFMNLS
jgi:hypothetical protein